MTPKKFPHDFFIMQQSPEEYSTDYCDFFRVGSTTFALVIAEVTGRGMVSSLSIREKFSSLLMTFVQQRLNIVNIMDELNSSLAQETACDHFTTCFYGELDVASQTIRYVNAGHDCPLLFVKAEQKFIEFASTGLPLGVLDDGEYREGEPVAFSPGDLLLLFSDGIIATINRQQEEFGRERFTQCIRNCQEQTVQQLCSECLATLEKFRGGSPLRDDLTLAAVKFTARVET